MTAQINPANLSLMRRYDELIIDLQSLITVARSILNRVENENLVLGDKTESFVSKLEVITDKLISSFKIVSDKRNELYNLEG